MTAALNPDLFVSTSESLTSHGFLFPATLGDQLRALPGVAEVQSIRNTRAQVRGAPVMLIAADVASLQRRAPLKLIQGDTDRGYRETAAGRALMVSENFANLHGCKLGESLSIPTPRGMLTLPVIGIAPDYSDQQGSVIMDRSVFLRYWNDDRANLFRIYLQPGYTDKAVRAEILDRLGSQNRLFVLTNADVRNYVIKLTDQWFGITWIQIAVAVLVAILGIVNSLTVSITDRRRELGVLQAVGGLRTQIRHTIWLEAVSIGIVGLALGLGFGAVQLFYTLETSRISLAGLTLAYEYPLGVALILLPVIVGAAWISALGPAESAVRGSLVEALEYE